MRAVSRDETKPRPPGARLRAVGAAAFAAFAAFSTTFMLAPAHAADPSKVIRHVFPAAETGFDPAGVQDLYSATIEQMLFETLLTYDYLARPAKLVPLTAEAMPVVTDGGKTYTVRIRKGIHFIDDPVFKGKKRELTAADYAYSLKRLVDPKLRSPWAWLVEGKIVGLDEVAEAAKTSGNFDYDAQVAGIETPDRYTLRIRLKEPDYNLPYILAHEPTSAVAREAIEAYRDVSGRAMSNPVGTGAYKLKQWVRSSKIILEANPDFRGFTWDFTSNDPEDQPLIAAMKGKKMPQVGRIEVSIIEEDQARLLAFQNGELDLMDLGGPLAPNVLDGGKLKPEFAKKGVKLSRIVDPALSYVYWNLQDPIVGGLTKDKIALRRAMAMAYNVDDEVRVVRNSQAIEAQYPIPPGVVGHDPKYRSPVKFDPAAANQLLDAVGYRKGPDGWRNLPDGKPFTIRYASRPDSLGRQLDELWKKALDSISVRMEVQKDKFPELLKLERQCKLMMRTASWIADYPDADNFMQLLYGKNIGQNNNGCAKIPEYDKLYEQTTRMPPSPERDRLYHEMARLIEVYAPWRLDVLTYRNMLVSPRVQGYKKHPILHAEWQFVDIGRPVAGVPSAAGGKAVPD
ncbi:MAG TPA: ABC transporter substrate-binding protein [Casimicrobiaceae bacterium]|nr:ABC transporter substrate-binding protein [Casimicrobiaceae bacterium]